MSVRETEVYVETRWRVWTLAGRGQMGCWLAELCVFYTHTHTHSEKCVCVCVLGQTPKEEKPPFFPLCYLMPLLLLLLLLLCSWSINQGKQDGRFPGHLPWDFRCPPGVVGELMWDSKRRISHFAHLRLGNCLLLSLPLTRPPHFTCLLSFFLFLFLPIFKLHPDPSRHVLPYLESERERERRLKGTRSSENFFQHFFSFLWIKKHKIFFLY